MFVSIEIALKKLKPDLIVISTPTYSHLDVVKQIFNTYSPKYLLCEKPLGPQFNQSVEIISL